MSRVTNIAATRTPTTSSNGQVQRRNEKIARPLVASRSVSGPARRKKNHAAPTMSQMRPSSDVNWRRLARTTPNATTAASVATTRSTPKPNAPTRRLARCIASPTTESSQARPRASGARTKTSTESVSIASQRWPWW